MSEFVKTLIARIVMSSKLPIGVETIYKPAFFIKNLISVLFIVVLSISSCSTLETPSQQDKRLEIAILMPLKGPNASRGSNYAELIKWGLEDKKDITLDIKTYDSSTVEDIRISMSKILRSSTKIILGPLLTPSVKEVQKYLEGSDIMLITMSNNPILGDDNTLVFGHPPLKQLNYLIDYTLSEGHKEYAILMPASKKSNNLAKVFNEIIKSREGIVVSNQQYNSDYDSKDKALSSTSTRVDEIIEDVDNEKKPIFYIAETNPKELKELYRLIKLYNLDSKSIIIGSSDLDIEFESGINITFAGSKMIPNKRLVQKALDELSVMHFNSFENLAYDLGAFTAVNIGSEYSRDLFFENIYNGSSYNGLSGKIKFDGPIATRSYKIITRNGSNYKILK